MASSLPATYRALTLTSRDAPFTVTTQPTPQLTPGAAIVRILVAPIVSYMGDIYNGTRPYPFPTPMTPGAWGVGRIAATGPDATRLPAGQLVLIDCVVRARDDPDALFLLGVLEGPSEGAKMLMAGEWRHGTFAEYAKVPLETCYPLDEARLLGDPAAGAGLGYRIEEVAGMARLLVPYGGLRDIGLSAGETVIVAPATGGFGVAAVQVALAMGARVIAMGRNQKVLERVAAMDERVSAVPILGDVDAEVAALKKHGRIDAFFDISPPMADKSSHFTSAIRSLRRNGRVSLMGGPPGDVALPHGYIMQSNLTLKGKFMYEPADVEMFLKLVESGVLKVGERSGFKTAGIFGLDQSAEAFGTALKMGSDEEAYFKP